MIKYFILTLQIQLRFSGSQLHQCKIKLTFWKPSPIPNDQNGNLKREQMTLAY
jgi:hypothetical protein